MPARLLVPLLAFSWLGMTVALPPLARRQDSEGIEVTSGIRSKTSATSPTTGPTLPPTDTSTATTQATVVVTLGPDASFWSNTAMIAGVFTTVALFLLLSIGAGLLFLRGTTCCKRQRQRNAQSEKQPTRRRSFFRPGSLIPIPRPVLLPITTTSEKHAEVHRPAAGPAAAPRQGPSRPTTAQSQSHSQPQSAPSSAPTTARTSFHQVGTEYGWLEPVPQPQQPAAAAAAHRRRSVSDPHSRRQHAPAQRPHTSDGPGPSRAHAPSAFSERYHHRAGAGAGAGDSSAHHRPMGPRGPAPRSPPAVQNGPPPQSDLSTPSSSRTVTFARQTAIRVTPPTPAAPAAAALPPTAAAPAAHAVSSRDDQIISPASERTVVNIHGDDIDLFGDLPPTLPLRIIRTSPGLSPSNSALSTASSASAASTVVAKFPLPPSTSPTVYSPSSPLSGGGQPPVTTPVAYNGPFRAMAPRGNVRPGTPQEVVRDWMRAAATPSPTPPSQQPGTDVGQAQATRGRSPVLNLVIPSTPSAPSSHDGDRDRR